MQARLRVISAGLCCTIQDAGRRGHLRNGVSTSGPMDWLSFEVARKLAGGAQSAPAIEVSVGGIEFDVLDGGVSFGLAGRGFEVSINGVAARYPARVHAGVGTRLTVKTGRAGAWFYVAPAAPMVLEPVLGSLATHARYRIGAWPTALLKTGDEIELGENLSDAGSGVVSFEHLVSDAPIRVVLGPQDRLFNGHDIVRFLSADFVLTLRNDRMAYVLEGPSIHPHKVQDLITDGTALGSIQIAGDGNPYVLMADRSSTGGYPKIATIIRADIGRFAQKRAGDRVRFERTDIGTAVQALRELKEGIDLLEHACRVAELDLDAVSEGRAISGVYNALEDSH